MMHEYTHSPVILLLDGSTSADNQFIKRWFQKSRFSTCEATDIFHALEEISDFTLPERPDVILLEVESMPDDYRVVKMMVETPRGQNQTPILAFSKTGKVVNDQACFEGDLTQLEAKLNLMIPSYTETGQKLAA